MALDGEVWLASHIRLWRAACWARRWLAGFRERRDAALLSLHDAGCTACEMGADLYGEVREAQVARVRSQELIRNANRRVGVLVCVGCSTGLQVRRR